MKSFLLSVGFCFGFVLWTPAANITVGTWTPIFDGIDVASGQQEATQFDERNHRTMCFRIDLLNPYIRLFTTPKCTNCSGDTLAENPSHFLETYGLQVAINGGFYIPSDQPLGTPEEVRGLAISEGRIVSPADDPTRAAALLFTTNNVPSFVFNNNPGTNTAGIYTAISGDLPLLINGVVAQAPMPFDLDPRTAMGVSENQRFLYLMTLDGRQPGWSDGADWYDTGLWIQRFGAYNAINVDGGGSTLMIMEDCGGRATRLNRSSYVATYGRERNVGQNLGVRARPVQGANKPVVTPGATTAIITWRTDFPSSTQVEFGLTSAYGSTTPLDTRLVRNHVATLAGLLQGSNYYYRVVSEGTNQSYSSACQFRTVTSANTVGVFPINQSWRYTTNNLDGILWKARTYDDSAWMGPGAALLTVLETNPNVSPNNTVMPPSVAPIPRTYYFRTHFSHPGPFAGLSLTFSNYVDDGAVFYLNGAEIYRLRMPAVPTVINNSTAAIAVPCTGTAMSGDAITTCPDVFTITGELVLDNLETGDNVVAVEVHNLATGNDLVFGSALLQTTPVRQPPTLNLLTEEGFATLFWNGEGFRLQESTDLSSPENWKDVAGPVLTSPFTVAMDASKFYRLRN